MILTFSIYTFFDKEPIAAKLLAIGGSIGILYLLIMSFKSLSKSKKVNIGLEVETLLLFLNNPVR